MEEDWVVKRCQFRQVWLEHPEWSHQKMAEALGCSKSWVKKWLRRIRSAPLEDQQVMYGLSHTPRDPKNTSEKTKTIFIGADLWLDRYLRLYSCCYCSPFSFIIGEGIG